MMLSLARFRPVFTADWGKFNAEWWKSEVNRSFFRCLATCRMRSSACDTLSRSCARRVLCWLAETLGPLLGNDGAGQERAIPADTRRGLCAGPLHH